MTEINRNFLGRQMERLNIGRTQVGVLLIVISTSMNTIALYSFFIGWNPIISGIIVILGAVFAFWFTGFILIKYGWYRQQIGYNASINPGFICIHEHLNRIEKMIRNEDSNDNQQNKK